MAEGVETARRNHGGVVRIVVERKVRPEARTIEGIGEADGARWKGSGGCGAQEGVVSKTAGIHKREGGGRLEVERKAMRVKKVGGRDAVGRAGETAVLAGKVQIEGRVERRAELVRGVESQSMSAIIQKIGFVGGIVGGHCRNVRRTL